MADVDGEGSIRHIWITDTGTEDYFGGSHNFEVGGRYLPLRDDISSVAFRYSDNLDDDYPKMPDKDFLEIM